MLPPSKTWLDRGALARAHTPHLQTLRCLWSHNGTDNDGLPTTVWLEGRAHGTQAFLNATRTGTWCHCLALDFFAQVHKVCLAVLPDDNFPSLLKQTNVAQIQMVLAHVSISGMQR